MDQLEKTAGIIRGKGVDSVIHHVSVNFCHIFDVTCSSTAQNLITLTRIKTASQWIQTMTRGIAEQRAQILLRPRIRVVSVDYPDPLPYPQSNQKFLPPRQNFFLLFSSLFLNSSSLFLPPSIQNHLFILQCNDSTCNYRYRPLLLEFKSRLESVNPSTMRYNRL